MTVLSILPAREDIFMMVRFTSMNTSTVLGNSIHCVHWQTGLNGSILAEVSTSFTLASASQNRDICIFLLPFHIFQRMEKNESEIIPLKGS